VDERGVKTIKHVECYPGQATWHNAVSEKRRVRCTRWQGAWGVSGRGEKVKWIKARHLTDWIFIFLII